MLPIVIYIFATLTSIKCLHYYIKTCTMNILLQYFTKLGNLVYNLKCIYIFLGGISISVGLILMKIA